MSVWGNIRELHGRILTHSCTAITELLVSLPLRELYFPLPPDRCKGCGLVGLIEAESLTTAGIA
jgi:hypothetical protein